MEIEENLVKEGLLLKKEDIKDENGIKEENMDVDDSSDKPFKTEIKKEDPDEIGTPRRRSSRLSKESINYDEDALSEKRERKVKEEVDTKRKKKAYVDESD